ncbi:MAG: SsrA-binding protein SmpB [Candidatus Paceibacterota bacterium]|jgi:SsrA-binding protein
MFTEIRNKKAHFNYDILEKFEAGIELFGFEVKSVKGGHGSLEGTRVIIRDNEAYLIGVNIPPYQTGNTPAGYDPTRTRKLLLTKKEIKELIGKGEQAGLTIVPLALYNKSGRIKVSIAVAKGRKKYDKREVLKKRDAERDIRRTLSS